MGAKKQTKSQQRSSALDEHVNEIMRMMTGGVWFPGRSDHEMGLEFGVSPSTVRDWSAQAARLLRMSAGTNLEEIRGRILAGIDGIRRMALARHRVVRQRNDKTKELEEKNVLDPDLRNALKCYELQARILGALREEPDAKPDPGLEFEGWSDDELDTYMRTGITPEAADGSNGKIH